MIGQAIRHGRTTRDARNLGLHLSKDVGARFEVINSAAPDLQSAMDDMQLSRDGSRADAAFLHLVISPSRDMNDSELRQAAEIVMKHFEASDHQAVLVLHDKNRRGSEGKSHAHLVLGRIGPDGQVISSGFEKIRMETAMRIVEFELGEAPVLGRHHASGIKWLRENGRSDVADYMISEHGHKPVKPRSAASPDKRQQIERSGADLGTVSLTVRSAWQRSDDAKAFAAALSENGLDVAAGQKPGVYIISKDGVEIGALDRLLKEKRNVVKSKMGEFKDGQAAKYNGSDESNLSSSQQQPQRSRSVETTVAAFRASGAERRRSDRADTAISGSNFIGAAASNDNGRGLGQKGRQFDERQTLIILDQIRLSSSTVVSMQEIKVHHKPFSLYEMHSAANTIEAHKTGWEWIQTFRDDLLEKIKELKDKVMGVERVTDKPVIKVSERPYDYHDDNHDDEEYQPPRFG